MILEAFFEYFFYVVLNLLLFYEIVFVNGLCLKCTLILNPSLCPLCRKDYTSAIDIIKSFCNKVREDYKNAPRFTPSDFPPLG